VSSLIVFAIFAVVFARRALAPDLRVAPTPGERGAATHIRDLQQSRQTDRRFIGTGDWVMSSLPGCFHETERARGTVAGMQSQFPPESERVRAGTVVRRGDCTIVVGEHDLFIARGGDRLRVPAEARLYAHGAQLTLVTIAGNVAQIRVY